MTFNHPDIFQNLRKLPADLQQALHILIIDRLGNSEDAYMRTENIIGYAEPSKTYQVGLAGMLEAPELDIPAMPEPMAPPRTPLTGQWYSAIDLTIKDANILGGNGRYVLQQGDEQLEIPIADATPEHLAYYKCHLVKVGEAVRFESTGNLPLTITCVGKDYAPGYLLDSNIGGGAYLEIHDRPHFHMPLDADCGGYLILGQENAQGVKEISAFKIPFGYAIHMSPWTIHADSYLVGRYMVIFSATPEFSTVIIRQQNGDLAGVDFI
ncbi:MAG: hypothetical protein V7784_04535 [Oceanospirillaceae bacterium]